MGALGILSGGSSDKNCGSCTLRETVTKKEYVNINPVPHRFEIMKSKQIGNYVLCQIKYIDCINYEGIKIVVFDGIELTDVLEMKGIDPHFFKDNKIIARFKPDRFGWKSAVLLCCELYKRDIGVYEI